MDQNQLINKISARMKLVRVENNLTQERMSSMLGISKKTLVQIEKKRSHANWTTTIALCALFRKSEVIQHTLGENVMEVVEDTAHKIG
ncbi:helix-turn-helix transcriptional regulator [Virgibacillus byunsanensis]|uniref:Helix-turn-helix transcriptional regulator n=1 Tax=Virgibacillus byunsanensis TaxID=570945 RepID=A0ABW3LN19_9BACI